MATSTLKEKTAKGLMWGGIGNGAQLILGCAFGIILARLLSPADYGMVGVLQIFLQIAALLQACGFSQALTNRKEFRHEDYNAVFWFNITTAVILYIILFLAAPLITSFYQRSGFSTGYNLENLTPLTRVCALGFVIASFGTAHYAYLFRTLQVKQKATITIISLTTSNLVGITMALCGCSYWSLAIQSLVYVSSNSILFWHFSHWHPTFNNIQLQPLREMLPFSSKLLATWIFNCINLNILSVMLGRFYSMHDVGYFNQANKWCNMAGSTLQGTLQDVTQPVLRNVTNDPERHRRVFRKLLRFTSMVTFPSMFGLAYVAKEFITITLTAKWLESAVLMQILCSCAFAIPLQALCMNLLIAKERSDMVLKNTLACGAVQLASVFFSYPFGIRTMVTVYALVNVVWLCIPFTMVCRVIGMSLRHALADAIPYAALAALSIMITNIAAAQISPILLRLITKIGLTAALYALSLWITRSVIFKESLIWFRARIKALLTSAHRRKS